MYIRLSFILRVLGVLSTLSAFCVLTLPYLQIDPGSILGLGYSFAPLQIGCAPILVSLSLFVMAWIADRLVRQDQQIAQQQKQIQQLQQMIKTHASKPGH